MKKKKMSITINMIDMDHYMKELKRADRDVRRAVSCFLNKHQFEYMCFRQVRACLWCSHTETKEDNNWIHNKEKS